MKQKELTALLTSLRNELKKEFVVYDGSDRPIEYYQAPINAEDGTPCLKTTVSYDGVSTRVEKSKEELALWDASYDI